MTGRATPRRVLADVLDLGAEAGAALAIVTATTLGALLRSAIDPSLRLVRVVPDHGWSPPDHEPHRTGGTGLGEQTLSGSW
jgi:hypothetical protein